MQKRAVLLHHADLAAQRGLRDSGDVLPINQNAARFRVVEPQQKLHQRGFARTRPAHKPDLFARFDDHIQILQTAPVAPIVMGQALHFDLALGQLQRLRTGFVHQFDRLGDGLHPLGHDAKLPEEGRQRPHDPARHPVQPQHQGRGRSHCPDRCHALHPKDNRPAHDTGDQQSHSA